MKKALTLIAAAGFLFTACKKEASPDTRVQATGNTAVLTEKMVSEDGNNPDEAIISSTGTNERNSKSGYVYVESNDASQNVVLVYRQDNDGRLQLHSQVISGGKGFGAGLASQGALALDKKNNLLFAVNAGSNSVSSFSIKENGGLELLSTASTGGEEPISVTSNGRFVYVVNSVSSDIAGFKIGENGQLKPIDGSYQTLSSAAAGPAQISFTPDGHALLISEKANNKITAFAVNSAGVAFNKTVNSSVGNTPFGFNFVRDQFVVVANADGGNVGTSSCTSYKNLDYLNIHSVNGKVDNGQSAVCWVGTSSFGRYAFAANTGSNTISAYYVDFSGRLYLIPWVNETTGGKPADIVVSSDNKYVYNINGVENTLGEYKRGLLGKLKNIGYVNALPDFAAGLVSY